MALKFLQGEIYCHGSTSGKDESPKWKHAKAGIEAESFTPEASPTSGVAKPLGHSVADIPSELLRVIGAQPGRVPPILHQPRGHVHGASGVSTLSHVRYALRERPQMPQMQEHRFARLSSRHQQPHLQDKEELELALPNFPCWYYDLNFSRSIFVFLSLCSFALFFFGRQRYLRSIFSSTPSEF